MMKAKLILIALCLCVVAASQFSQQTYAKGFNDGVASIEQPAFDSYVHFARQMQVETKQHKSPAKANDVFAKAGF